MVESQGNGGSDRVGEGPSAEPRACESPAHKEVTQERQSAAGIGEQEKELNRANTNLLETSGQLPVCSISDKSPAESGRPGTPKQSEKKTSEADEMLDGFSISPERSPNLKDGDSEKVKAASLSTQPFNLSASEYRDLLRAGPEKGIGGICSTVPQAPAVSKKEIENTCGIDLRAKYPEVQKGVVQVYGEGGRIGTGFLACERDKCQIVTDEHVVGEGKQVMIVKDGKATPGSVTGRDPDNDLATISIDPRRLPGLKPLSLGSGEGLREGAPVFAVGHGRQLPEQSVTPGKITKPSVDVRTNDGGLYLNQFDTDMKAVPGHSGSPILDKEGKVIGVIGSSGRTGSSGPKVERVKELLRRGAQ